MSTKIKIPVKHWNKNRQRVKQVTGRPEYYRYNNTLDKYERALQDGLIHFSQIDQTPSVQQLKDRVIEEIDGAVAAKEKFNTLYKYSKDYTERKEGQGKFAKGTIDGYKQLLKVLSSLPKGKTISFEDLTVDVLTSMTVHMVKKYDYSSNMINKIQRKLCAVVNEARVKGYNINNGYYSKEWKVKSSKLNDEGIAYTPEEITKIADVWLPERLDRVRDRFLIGISVGQRYSDFKGLCIDNVVEKNKKKYFNIVQKKTQKPVLIPLSPNVEAILNKYDGYPPSISSQKFNKYLKEIGELVKMNDDIIVRKENPIDGIVKEERKKKYQIMSSHDCRRTFCTIAHNNGIPVGAIMQISGHTSLATFSKYLKIDLTSKNLQVEVF